MWQPFILLLMDIRVNFYFEAPMNVPLWIFLSMSFTWMYISRSGIADSWGIHTVMVSVVFPAAKIISWHKQLKEEFIQAHSPSHHSIMVEKTMQQELEAASSIVKKHGVKNTCAQLTSSFSQTPGSYLRGWHYPQWAGVFPLQLT